MSERDKHLHYRGKRLECSFMRPICSKAEVQVLEKYGAWMEALYHEKITPITNRQKQFCRHIKSDTPPEEFYALLFWKYLKRKEIAQSSPLNNNRKKIKDDREDWKKIRKMRF